MIAELSKDSENSKENNKQQLGTLARSDEAYQDVVALPLTNIAGANS